MIEYTLPQLLQQNYERYSDKKVALRVKNLGIWQEYTWKDYYEKVRYFALGLVSLGFERGDKLCILGENKPEWYWAEMAALSVGGVVIGVFTDCMPKEVKYYIEHSDAKFVVAEDQEQVDKLLEIKDELPLLKKVIYWDLKGVWNYSEPILISFDGVIDLGKEYERLHPDIFETSIKQGNIDDTAVFCYTSGTTGQPKAAMLSHRAVIRCGKAFDDFDHWSADEEYVSFIQPAWLTEQGLGIAGSLFSGMTVNFPEDVGTVQDNIREIGADVLFWGTRNWESVNRMIQSKMVDASAFNRFLYRIFLPVGYMVADKQIEGEQPSWIWRFLNFIAYWAIFRDLKDKVGLSKAKHAYTSGAGISPDLIRFFRAVGVNVKQDYGSTEGGMLSFHHDSDVKPETAGIPCVGVDIRLSAEGELQVRGPNIFSGYYKNPEATAKKMKNGWFYTEDFGYITEEGHVVCMDRMADLKELSDGRKFSPQYAEIRLRFSSYIKDALIIGGGNRDYVTCLINIDLDNVGRWAEQKKIPYTTFTDLSQKPEVIELIRNNIEMTNRTIPEWARIKKFANMHREFDADEAELTRTRKIKRTFVEKRYKDLIEVMYSEVTELNVETPVTYRDGRAGVIKVSVKINSVEQKGKK